VDEQEPGFRLGDRSSRLLVFSDLIATYTL